MILSSNERKLKKRQSKQSLSLGHKEQASTVKVGEKRYVSFNIICRDTGVGISDEGIKKLFIDFGKLDENSKMNRQGTGLGLSICK